MTDARVRSNHIESIRAGIRATVVTRSDADWTSYGFSLAERDMWVSAGIPADRAHLAAMCRDATALGGGGVTPRYLRLQLDNQTVLQALLDGSNMLRLQVRIARQLKLRLTFTGDVALALGVYRAEVFEVPGGAQAVTQLQAGDARSMPALLDALHVLGAHEIERMKPVIALYSEVQIFTETGVLGSLFRDAALSFGVYHGGQPLTELAKGITVHKGKPEHLTEASRVLTALSAGRHMYYADQDISELIRHAAQDLVTTVPLSPADLPSATGLLWLSANGEDPIDRVTARILAWTTDLSGTLTVTTSTAAQISKRMNAVGQIAREPLGTAKLRLSEAGTDTAPILDATFDQNNRSLPLLVAFMHLLGSGVNAEPDDEPELVTPPVQGRRTPVSDSVLLLSPRTSSSSAHPGSGAPRHSQWTVRGHWRRQWYPAAGIHKVLWIREHWSGSVDAPILHRQRVYVLRSPGLAPSAPHDRH